MALTCYHLPQSLHCNPPNAVVIIRSSSKSNISQTQIKKLCLKCNTLYLDKDNSPTACSFHGHSTGEKGLFSLAPPHQGIDGEWTDASGVIVYKWNEKSNRPNTGSANWKKRWSCCAEYDENAPPCRQGWHASYDDGFTLY
ncbi:uncharacterized protein LOC8278993 [Ricinus communis]|uniref:Uncharacterized protein n=1 Tax=Ricinus communis TaxID=3988 RepID=B9SL98_RICCO|nr:uncharacterized protein LOC8278993 [Ricinus communis]EEF35621.1 conserved hypothetical protein [Ricinus communis]|eukprot:XP_002526767.1 uncharacterized protein LOC8278993 [Ricinus communis]